MIIDINTALQEILEHSLAGYWDWDIPSGNEYLSPAFKKMFGYEDHEIPNRAESWKNLIFPEDLPGVIKTFDEHVKSKGAVPYFNEVRYRHKDGSTVWVICTGKVMEWNEKGAPVRMVGCHVDITGRKQAEEALRESENRNRSILKAIPDIMFIHNREGLYLDYHASNKNLLAVDPEIFLHKTIHQIIPASVADEALVCFERAHRTGETQIFEYELDIMGDKKHFECRVTSMDDERILTIVRDITDRKRSEQALANTQKLESLGLLAGGIAHDFNNLLFGIYGCINLATLETKKHDASSHLTKAIGTINRARALTQQLLTFAKGGDPIQKIQTLFPFVQETAQFALSGSSVACRCSVADDIWPCNFDKNQIGQVIDNLVINAQQAMPEGGTLEISAQNVVLAEKEHLLLAKGNYVKLSVKDIGVGIPRDILTKIFDPFFTTKEKGHGLGLATCYSIIKRHGGCIDVESKPGIGSIFTIYLPAASENAAAESSGKTETHRGTGTFLIMDDEEVIRNILKDMLESFGYSVISKKNGKGAIEYFNENPGITGVILDLTIPGGMGGRDAVAEIRKLNRDIPVFLVSGYAHDPVMKDPCMYGFTASLSKPFLRDELSELLNRHMKSGPRNGQDGGFR